MSIMQISRLMGILQKVDRLKERHRDTKADIRTHTEPGKYTDTQTDHMVR